MAVFAGGRLQLAFHQLLQVVQAMRLVDQRLQRLGIAQYGEMTFGGKGTERHSAEPDVD